MPRRTAEVAAQTRDAIVEAARQAFAEHGFAGASTASIADAACVTRGAVYHHFAGKTDLFRAAFEALVVELDATVRTAARAKADPREAFMTGCEALLRFMLRDDYRRIAAVDGPAVLGVDEWHATDAATGMHTLAAGLRAMHEEGYLLEPPTPTMTVLVFGALTEAGVALRRGEPGISVASILEELGRLLDRFA